MGRRKEALPPYCAHTCHRDFWTRAPGMESLGDCFPGLVAQAERSTTSPLSREIGSPVSMGSTDVDSFERDMLN